MIDEMSDGEGRQGNAPMEQAPGVFKNHDYIMNANIRELCGVSAATANRILVRLTAEKELAKFKKFGHWI
ncbi:hypothetical protein LIZ94_17165 [Flavonifractor plautii]|jgi:hypothetical protein|uniref:hypothetical protein n=1 Tax=Flavonifractor plautii TaxID=292800 RepID=UPI001897D8B3|nr:hypothetical protein [Flavonifractor plautii]MBS5659158.1 hypothetical protein [Oscillibacter sp.]MCB6875161.1 hypothetical protein [Flavonifractor plautii]MCB7360651.1 hypothetical protein [Flavonifractor plautii]MDB7912580.1 hypothetical protein [Flavonifractor plautii]MDB7916577.1 hypothetical protein [Flavonifractor plautii]